MSQVRVGEKLFLRKKDKKVQKFYSNNVQKLAKNSRPISDLKIGDTVKVFCQKSKSFSKTAKVINFGNTKYSYFLQDSNGSRYYRHRRHCKLFNPPKDPNCNLITDKQFKIFPPQSEKFGGDVRYRDYLNYHFPQLKGCVSVNKHIAPGRAGAFAVAAA